MCCCRLISSDSPLPLSDSRNPTRTSLSHPVEAVLFHSSTYNISYLRRIHSQPIVCLSEVIEDNAPTITLTSRQHNRWRAVRLRRHPCAMPRVAQQHAAQNAHNHGGDLRAVGVVLLQCCFALLLQGDTFSSNFHMTGNFLDVHEDH